MEKKAWQTLLAAVLAAVSAYARELLIPVLVLFAVMLLDYGTGVAVAWKNCELSSRTGLIGIVKKVGYLAVVSVGSVLDYILRISGERLGRELPLSNYFGLLVTIWLIINECISILENADALGLPVPAFVGAALERLKKRSEEETPGEQV
ncbi:MAG: phage holin family protein [Clostridiales bacterium]|nr:phage holin family protein [Candidatus Apopatocola equi]MCQ2438876.1 phage holin family protein [Oscillospiraceae bacterium]